MCIVNTGVFTPVLDLGLEMAKFCLAFIVAEIKVERFLFHISAC